MTLLQKFSESTSSCSLLVSGPGLASMPGLFQVVTDGFGAHPKSSRTLNEEH